jgi:threonylcarbamoyladenosine tRNA methylthiotransferase MtaB
MSKTFLAINFGCRVNSAETNQWSQILINQGFIPCCRDVLQNVSTKPNIIIINTCSITKKGDIESLSKVRILSKKFSEAKIYVTGCANLEKLKDIPNIFIYQNTQKEELLKDLNSSYTPKIKDKFSHTNRFLLKVQSGCTTNCSYCIVPLKRPYLWSLPIKDAIDTVNSAIKNGYKEIIITGVNLNQYQYGFSNLLEALLTQTNIPLISFGSIPLNCIDKKFIELIKNFKLRISNFIHIPLQSGSDKILKLMSRPYIKKDILEKFDQLKSCVIPSEVEESSKALKFGTDIIIGFPSESEKDFQETYDLCQSIGFSKIHTFKFSPRPNTKAWDLYNKFPKLSPKILKQRSQSLQKLSSSQ